MAYLSELILMFLTLVNEGPKNKTPSFSINVLLSCAVVVFSENNKTAKMKAFFISRKKGLNKYMTYLMIGSVAPVLNAQTPDKITVKKEDAFYFFQAGKKTDTISAGKNDRFYLKMSGNTS